MGRIGLQNFEKVFKKFVENRITQEEWILIKYSWSHPKGRDHLDAGGCPRVSGEK